MQLNEFRNDLHNREFDEAPVFIIGKDGVIVEIKDHYQIQYITDSEGKKKVLISATGMA